MSDEMDFSDLHALTGVIMDADQSDEGMHILDAEDMAAKILTSVWLQDYLSRFRKADYDEGYQDGRYDAKKGRE